MAPGTVCHANPSASIKGAPHDGLGSAHGRRLVSELVGKREEAEWSLQRSNHENPSALRGASLDGAGSAWNRLLATGSEEQGGRLNGTRKWCSPRLLLRVSLKKTKSPAHWEEALDRGPILPRP